MRRGLASWRTAPFASETISELQHRSADFVILCTIFEHMSVVVKIASTIPYEKWQSDLEMQSNFLVAAHRLLSMPRFGVHDVVGSSSGHVALTEALRLALLLFMLGPISKMAGNHEWEWNYSGRIPSLLKAAEVDWSRLEDLELWVVVLGALHERGDDREWLVARISQRMKGLRLDWRGMIQILRRIVWIDEAFAEAMARLEEDWGQHATTVGGAPTGC